ncbi:GNAT family N-acetyltransferase [Pseudomonas gingeri]|uniref:GNAT family N-acetyltransferase n=1 Tax=Pseudomonas sp. Mn2068 TaxID=3395265 RepID=UPI003BE0F510
MHYHFRLAADQDVDTLVCLINAAYRPGADLSGWTHEGAILDGPRIDAGQLRESLATPGVVLLVMEIDDVLTACVEVRHQGEDAYIGTLAVLPGQQNSGIGKMMLGAAEAYAIEQLKATRLVMSVLSGRVELINFYVRRGYVRSGKLQDFPLDAGVGVPKVSRLVLETLYKTVPQTADA